jgi:hypothetical protein
MDIEKINTILTKAIVGFQEGEIDELIAIEEASSKPVGEDGLETIRKICKDHSAAKVNGMMIDAASACLIIQIADKLNPTNRKKFIGLPIATMGHIAWEMTSKSGSVKFKSV